MRGSDFLTQSALLEAPGDFLSELLAVCAAGTLSLRGGALLELPADTGLWQVLTPLSGEVRVTAGETSFPLSPGQAACVPGAEEAALLPAGDCELGLLSLRGTAADRVFARCLAEGGLFFERGGGPAERALRTLLSQGGRQVSAREASGRAYTLLMALCGTGTKGPAGGRAVPPVVEAALGILRRDYAFLEGIGELAARLEVSQEYLTRCFCKYIGVTPGKYLNQVRIENAKLLLREGQHPVQFVSDACGFSNANYFARVFCRSVGMNPREYARLELAPLSRDTRDESLYVL